VLTFYSGADIKGDGRIRVDAEFERGLPVRAAVAGALPGDGQILAVDDGQILGPNRSGFRGRKDIRVAIGTYGDPFSLEKDLVIDSFNHTFGGILQYTARAIADYERHQREIEATARGARDAAKIRHATEAIQSEAQAKRTALAESRLASLSREEYDAFYAAAKADLRKGQFGST
jgi:hypothetical protein